MIDSNYEKLLILARISEKAERYEEAIKYIKDIITFKKGEITIEERNILISSFKKCISSRRSAWRTIYTLEVKEKENKSKFSYLITNLKDLLESELTNICDQMFELLNNYLLKASEGNEESKVLYLKTKADYYRYLAEFKEGDENKQVAKNSLKCYEEANKLSENLICTNPVKLGLALNYSVFHYEVLNDPRTACKIANEAFNDAIHQLEKIADDQYQDSTTILQLLKDNIDMWKTELQEGEDDEDKE